MGPCDLAKTGKAYNEAIEAFRKAWLSSGGNLDKSLRFAISETKRNHPKIDFDSETLTNPIIAHLKSKGKIGPKYEFGKKAAKNRKKNTDSIKELADKIAKGDVKIKSEPKPSEFTEDEKKQQGFILSKYGKNLNKSQFDALMDESVNGTQVKEIVDAQMSEDKDTKAQSDQVRKEQKEIEKEAKQKAHEAEKLEKSATKKIEAAVKKMTNLTPNQQKELAIELMDSFLENGTLDDARVKNLYAKTAGLPHMTPEMDGLIDKIVDNNKKLDEVDKEIREAQKEAEANPASYAGPSASSLQKKRNALRTQATVNSKQTAAALAKKGYWISDFADQIQLGLMGVKSLIKNATGTLPDAIIRQFSGGAASLVSNLLIRPFTKLNSNPFGARFRGGTKNSRQALGDAWLALKYKQKAFTSTQHEDNMSAAHEWKKAMDSHGLKKVLLGISAALKISPDVVGRVLSATDAIPKSLAYTGELSRIAESKGLKGPAKEFFLLNPDEESHQKAIDYAMDVTFEGDLTFPVTGKKLNFNFDQRAEAEKLIKSKDMNPMLAHTLTSIAKIGINLNVPFVKVPINILKKAGRLAAPEIVLISGAMKINLMKDKPWAEKQVVLANTIGEAAVGYYVRWIALQMGAAGLMSAGWGDDEKETEDNTEKRAGGKNRINRSALMRLMFTPWQKVEHRDTDVYVPNTFFGALGVTLGGYAHSFNMMSKEELEKYNDEFSDKFRPQVAARAVWGSAIAALDNPFFTGTNNIMKALSDKEGDKATKLAITWSSMLGGGILPAAYQKFSTSATSEQVSRYDKERTGLENLTTELGYKFAFQSKDLKKKYFSLANEGEAMKKKNTMFFDNLFGRALYETFSMEGHSSIKGTPDSKLYDAQKEVGMKERGELFPTAIEPKIQVKVGKKWSNGRYVSVEKSVALTDEQYEYLQEKASVARLLGATPYIMSPDFEKSNYSTKVEKLKKIYKEGLDLAKKMTLAKYPDLKTQEEAASKKKTKSSEVDAAVMKKTY